MFVVGERLASLLRYLDFSLLSLFHDMICIGFQEGGSLLLVDLGVASQPGHIVT